ncbi:MAG: N-acetylmuramoyl-L-alanine amidase [Verrucomicrobia bacterium]|nr:N-acetylmuramoyl-L-alanine amidase [Verrucomicrobiota bacterium]
MMKSISWRWLTAASLFLLASEISPWLNCACARASYARPEPAPIPTGTREWRYIVIHHSGATKGNEDIIQTGHLHRGMENGMAYHFLIGNGSAGLGDGAIVEGHRWKFQLQGGHCHQDHLNDCGIGICLIGNFNRKGPTARQMASLGKLLLRLQTEFHIPEEYIHGHGQFYGEDSDCPGRLFSWTNLWTSLNSASAGRQSPQDNHTTDTASRHK